MKSLKEKLKKIGSALSAAAGWVGKHLAACLTIFSVVVGILFLRERKKRQEAETTAELNTQAATINHLKEEVQANENEANESLADYESANAAYERAGRGKKATASASRQKPRAKKRASGKLRRSSK